MTPLHTPNLRNALADLVWDSYKPFFENDRVKMLMRMLAANRYADKNCKALYETIFIERPIAIQGTIFERLVSEGRFGPCDTQLTAVQFHSPYAHAHGATVRSA